MTFDLSSRVSHDEDEDLQSPAQSVICNLSYSLVNQYILLKIRKQTAGGLCLFLLFPPSVCF